jgi:hypothetical protein
MEFHLWNTIAPELIWVDQSMTKRLKEISSKVNTLLTSRSAVGANGCLPDSGTFFSINSLSPLSKLPNSWDISARKP